MNHSKLPPFAGGPARRSGGRARSPGAATARAAGILVPFEGDRDPRLQATVSLERAEVLADGRHFYESAAACDIILRFLRGHCPHPGEERCRRLRARAWACKGRALEGAGHHREALACLDRAFEQKVPAGAAGAPMSASGAAERARADSLRASALAHLGRFAEALAIHRGAVSELRLLVAHGGHEELAEELARALTRLGSALLAADHPREAACALDEAIPIFDRLVWEGWREDLARDLDGALEERVEARGGMEG